MKRYEIHKKQLALKLHGLPGKKHITTDIWTSPSQDPFMAITLHSLDDNFEMVNELIAFKEVRQEHTGENLAKVYRDVIAEYGLGGQIGCITLDNAANNNTFISSLVQTGDLSSKECHVRCFGHVLNLAAQAVLHEIRDKIDNLREGIKAIKWSTNFTDLLQEQCAKEVIEYKAIVLDVVTRWNSTVDMLQRAIHLRPALTTVFKQLSKRRNSDIEEISDEEWTHFQLFAELLSDFKTATEICSGDKYVTFSSAMPWYNALLENCDEFKVCEEVQHCLG